MSNEQSEKSRFIHFDFDGFVSNYFGWDRKICKEDLRNAVIATLCDPSVRDLQEMYYLNLRNSMIVSAVDEDEFRRVFKIFSEDVLRFSYAATHLHLTGKPIEPDWVQIALEAICEEMKEDVPEISEIGFVVSMEPRFHARAKTNDLIEISALTRTILLQLNKTIYSEVFGLAKRASELPAAPDVASCLRFSLPYLIYSHDVIPVSRLPFTSSESSSSTQLALNSTYLQTLFIIAHEVSHIVLGHLEKEIQSDEQRRELENEADWFALAVLKSIVAKDSRFDLGDLRRSIWWLFEYRLLEWDVGLLLDGQSHASPAVSHSYRFPRIDSAFETDERSREDILLENQGNITIWAMRHALIELGTDFIRDVTDELVNEQFGDRANWWTEIDFDSEPILTEFEGTGEHSKKTVGVKFKGTSDCHE